MTQCSTYSEKFTYVIVGRIESVSYTKCTKSAVKHLKSALSVKYCIAYYSTDRPKSYM